MVLTFFLAAWLWQKYKLNLWFASVKTLITVILLQQGRLKMLNNSAHACTESTELIVKAYKKYSFQEIVPLKGLGHQMDWVLVGIYG